MSVHERATDWFPLPRTQLGLWPCGAPQVPGAGAPSHFSVPSLLLVPRGIPRRSL